ncbi:MAG: flavodoxin family protein [Spirochaetia bacterium]|jgi:multimeric flavodoxin WrbA|nr:flavodoxin family protein [Spirochaetia bacterium]
MKVLMINGSPREHGCTYTALDEIAKTLKDEGLESEILYVGNVQKAQDRQFVAQVAQKLREADGFVVGSPVYYAAPSQITVTLLVNLFGILKSEDIRLKPAAGVASARRAGTTSTIDQINKFFLYGQMPVVSSQYWPMVHGNSPADVLKDEEGLQIMRTLARNMAWMIKSFSKAALPKPKTETIMRTNFIR